MILQKPTELRFMMDILRAENARNILEIGAADGGLTLEFAKMVRLNHGMVYSIDFFEGEHRDYKDEPAKDCIVEITGDSHAESTVKALAEKLNGTELDFLFIDGDHRIDGAIKDFMIYAAFVKKHGLVGLHDISKSGFNIHIHNLWESIKKDFNHMEIVAPNEGYPTNDKFKTWGGIGIIEK